MLMDATQIVNETFWGKKQYKDKGLFKMNFSNELRLMIVMNGYLTKKPDCSLPPKFCHSIRSSLYRCTQFFSYGLFKCKNDNSLDNLHLQISNIIPAQVEKNLINPSEHELCSPAFVHFARRKHITYEWMCVASGMSWDPCS